MTDSSIPAITGALCEWEDNGYHDSDGYVAYWTGEEIATALIWTTRGVLPRPPIVKATDAELLAARAWLEDLRFGEITRNEERRILEPNKALVGDSLTLLEDVTFTDKKSGRKIEAKADDTGRVFWQGAFGRFFRNGYNTPGRSNTRVGLELTNGDRIFVALSKCRLAEQPPTLEKVRALAVEDSWRTQFCKGAWPTWTEGHRLTALRNPVTTKS